MVGKTDLIDMNRFVILFISSLIFVSCNTNKQEATGTRLLEVKKLDHYPSASGIEYVDSLFYVIGDDAKYLLILDHKLDPFDSIILFQGAEQRLPKETKADLESILFFEGEFPKIWLLASGSLSPYRDTLKSFLLATKEVVSFPMDYVLGFLKKEAGLKDINIEGSVFFNDAIILANRGNKSWPHNHLFYSASGISKNWITEIERNDATTNFKGVSGLDNAWKHDYLLLTFSTEDTRNSYDDGIIGASYLGIIKNASSRKFGPITALDSLINLDSIDTRFKGQKIESVCVVREVDDEIELVLCADNDDGSSTLFRMILKIPPGSQTPAPVQTNSHKVY